MDDFVVISGTANPPLARAIAAELGLSLAKCRIERFPDGEVTAEVEESVRQRQVFLVQPTAPPVNDHLVELIALADACRRAAADWITAVVPYFGYARADRRKARRVPIMARAAANVIEASGIDHLAPSTSIRRRWRASSRFRSRVSPLCRPWWMRSGNASIRKR